MRPAVNDMTHFMITDRCFSCCVWCRMIHTVWHIHIVTSNGILRIVHFVHHAWSTHQLILTINHFSECVIINRRLTMLNCKNENLSKFSLKQCNDLLALPFSILLEIFRSIQLISAFSPRTSPPSAIVRLPISFDAL